MRPLFSSFAIVFLSSIFSAQAQTANHCISLSFDEDDAIFKNRCDRIVVVSYCHPGGGRYGQHDCSKITSGGAGMNYVEILENSSKSSFVTKKRIRWLACFYGSYPIISDIEPDNFQYLCRKR